MSASFTQARTDIGAKIAAIVAGWTDYTLAIQADNRLIDFGSQTNPFLRVDTVFLSAEQLDIGISPHTQQYSQLLLSAACKEGTGVLLTNKLLDYAIPFFHNQEFGVVRFKVAQRQKDKPLNGWNYSPVLFNFTYLW